LLRVKWANKRIKKVDVLAHNYVNGGRAFRIEIAHDQAVGKKRAIIKFLEDIPDDLIAETHAALGFLRASLDAVAWAVANRFGAPKYPKNVSFPVAVSQKAFEVGMQGKIRQIGDDWVAFVAMLKPYKGGNDLLYDLHDFNNADKHRTLTRVGQNSDVASFSAPIIGETSFNVAMFGFALGDGDMLVTVGEFDPDPIVKLQLGISFCEVGPEAIRGNPVVSTLKAFTGLCEGIIDATRSLFQYADNRPVRVPKWIT